MFVPAFAIVLKALDLDKIDKQILGKFYKFLSHYEVLDCHKDYDLQQLFRLAQIIKAPFSWISQANSSSVVVSDFRSPELYVTYIDVVRLFMNYPTLYSWPYIQYMEDELTPSGLLRLRNTNCFLDLLANHNVKFIENELPLLSK
jgi:hypothetical protein